MALRIAHLSDLHFGRLRQPLAGALLEQLTCWVPDLVAVSGDLTQHARVWELLAVRRFLDRLPGPVLAVPGNHDMPAGDLLERFANPWGRWQRIIGEQTEPVVSGQGFLAMGVNTARRWGPHWDWSRGRINDRQLERVEGLMMTAGQSALGILVAHHPFLSTPAGAHRGLVGRAESALPRLRRAGVDLVLGGHVHLGYAGVIAGLVVAQSGTTLSDRLQGEANHFNFIVADTGRIRVSAMTWAGTDFQPTGQQAFENRSGRWQAAGQETEHRP